MIDAKMGNTSAFAKLLKKTLESKKGKVSKGDVENANSILVKVNKGK